MTAGRLWEGQAAQGCPGVSPSVSGHWWRWLRRPLWLPSGVVLASGSSPNCDDDHEALVASGKDLRSYTTRACDRTAESPLPGTRGTAKSRGHRNDRARLPRSGTPIASLESTRRVATTAFTGNGVSETSHAEQTMDDRHHTGTRHAPRLGRAGWRTSFVACHRLGGAQLTSQRQSAHVIQGVRSAAIHRWRLCDGHPLRPRSASREHRPACADGCSPSPSLWDDKRFVGDSTAPR
jgi:hypothetical protein